MPTCHISTALQFYLRSETIGSSGISNPPRSIIEIDGKDYSKNLDGFNIATIDILSGVVESSVNFRVDSDQSAALPFIQYLQRIPGTHSMPLLIGLHILVTFNCNDHSRRMYKHTCVFYEHLAIFRSMEI